MRAAVYLLAVVAACYSPRATTGAPCSPELANCPDPQTCALVGGSYVCVEGPVPDAATDSGARADAPGDARPDAFVPPDAPPDAAGPRWSLIQTAQSTNPSVTLTPPGAGHLLIVAIETNASSPVVAVTDSVGDTFTAIAGSRAINTAASLGIELWAATTGQNGAMAIGVSAPVIHAIVVWEVAGIRATSPLDRVASLNDQAATTTPTGAAITTTAGGEFVVSVAIVANQISGIHTGNAFTNDRTTFGNGWAHLTSTAAPAGSYQAKWDQGTAGAYCATSAGFFVGP